LGTAISIHFSERKESKQTGEVCISQSGAIKSKPIRPRLAAHQNHRQGETKTRKPKILKVQYKGLGFMGGNPSESRQEWGKAKIYSTLIPKPHKWGVRFGGEKHGRLLRPIEIPKKAIHALGGGKKSLNPHIKNNNNGRRDIRISKKKVGTREYWGASNRRKGFNSRVADRIRGGKGRSW